MTKKKVQHVLDIETIVRLKALATLSHQNQSELLTSLIDGEWEHRGLNDLFPKSTSQDSE